MINIVAFSENSRAKNSDVLSIIYFAFPLFVADNKIASIYGTYNVVMEAR